MSPTARTPASELAFEAPERRRLLVLVDLLYQERKFLEEALAQLRLLQGAGHHGQPHGLGYPRDGVQAPDGRSTEEKVQGTVTDVTVDDLCVKESRRRHSPGSREPLRHPKQNVKQGSVN